MGLDTGDTLGRYEITGRLGQGGMAAVYRARDPSLERVVALKVIRTDLTDDPEFIERFRREARAVARLDHPNIVQVYEFAEADGMPFLAMQYLEGGTLKQRVSALAASGRRMARNEAVAIIAQVADALAYAHGRGIVHRDVKPANVMLTADGRAVVTDFGIAKIVSGTQYTQTGVGIGTPEYMSPEQGQGATVDARSDVYSLGVMAFELLTGQLPFTADTPVAVVIKHMRDPLPPPSSIDPSIGRELDGALARSLAKDPKDRYPSASDFATALRAAAGGADGVTAPTIVVPRERSPRRALPGRPVLLAATGAALLLLGGGAAVVTLQGGGGTSGITPSPAVGAAGETRSPVTATNAPPVIAAASPTATPAPTPSPPAATPTPAATATSAPVTLPPAATVAPTAPPAAPAPTPAITGPRSVAMEKATFSASRERLGIIVANYPVGTEVVLVSSRHESGFEQALGTKFSTNTDPYAIRFDWTYPTGRYTMRVTAGGTPYDLTFTVTN